MAVTYSIAVNVCDDCGHRWIPEGESKRCPSRKCRSVHWNAGGTVHEGAKAAPQSTEPIGSLVALLGLTVASKLQEATQRIEYVEEAPTIRQCAYTEYVGDAGETYRCKLDEHGPKTRHQLGNRI